MIDIIRLHIHYRDLKGIAHKKTIKPSDATDTLRIKRDIAQVITKIKGKAEYYYVVVEVDRGGKSAFRTIIPKTLLSA